MTKDKGRGGERKEKKERERRKKAIKEERENEFFFFLAFSSIPLQRWNSTVHMCKTS